MLVTYLKLTICYLDPQPSTRTTRVTQSLVFEWVGGLDSRLGS